ncbi:MAG: pilus assembly protein TadG-related protein [Bryobacteraceae bacterium]
MKRYAVIVGGEDGQAVILVVAAMSIFLIGALGLAIDGAQMYAQRQMAQAAADAAAQAGIMSMLNGTNATSAYPFGTTTASSTCTASDHRTPCVYAQDNGFGTPADTVTLSYPATVSGVTLSSLTAIPALTVTVQRTLQTGLIRLVGGPASSSITAKATAGLVGTVLTQCVDVLDPSAQSAFQANNGATIAINGCSVSTNSTNADAMTITGGATVSASAINSVGGVVLNNGGSTTPAAVTGVAPVANPFASLPTLTPGSCTTHPTMTNATSGETFSQGTYCGGITVSNGVTGVSFAAGDYIINGGGITFAGGTTSTGSGVMFYLTGTNATYASVTMSNGVNVTLSAPTSGPYMGVLFYQDPSITSSSPATFTGGATMQLTGSLYFPTTAVSFSNGTGWTGYTAIIADTVSFTGGALPSVRFLSAPFIP